MALMRVQQLLHTATLSLAYSTRVFEEAPLDAHPSLMYGMLGQACWLLLGWQPSATLPQKILFSIK